MLVFLPFFILSAVTDLIICLNLDCRGWALLGCAVLLYIVSFLAWAAFYVLFFGILSLFVDQNKPQEKVDRFWRFAIIWTMGLSKGIFGVRLHTEGLEKVPVQGRWLYVCNHRSGFDPIVAGWALRDHDVAFITKPSIMRIPIANKAIHKACFMAIDRENDREALKTIVRAAQFLKNDVTNIGIYPEGTRTLDGDLQEFRNGAFKIAQKAKVPIVVATIKNTEKIVKNFPFRRTDVYLKICRVIPAEEVEAMKTNEIGEEARKCMLENV